MTDTKPPSAEAVAFADWVLEFLVGYKTWAIEENRSALAWRIDAFAERRAAEGQWPSDNVERLIDQMGARGYIASGANLTWMAGLVCAFAEQRVAEARGAAIEECAKIAEAHMTCGCGRADCYTDRTPEAVADAIRASPISPPIR